MVWMILLQGLLAQTRATFGTVVPLRGTPSDIVLDERRNRLYLVSSTAGSVSVYDYAAQSVIATVPVGQNPLGAAISMDNAFLYVANHDSSSLSVLDLNQLGAVTTVSLPTQPEGVEVGADGRVLISTDGTQTNSLANILLLYDGTQASPYQVLPVVFPAPPATPSVLPLLLARPTTQFNGALKRTPDGAYIVGVSPITNNNSTAVFVYDVASGTVLQSRHAVGQSSTLSMAPDGLSFMAGFTLYDTRTLNVLAQHSNANAPFAMTNFSATFNVGGSVFSPDGKTLYSAFNTAALANPPPAPQASTLLIADGHNLAISLGINLPQSIIGKMVMTSDGAQAWGLSPSGLIYLPLSTLYTYPILMPSSTSVFLAQDDCSPGVATAGLKITNIGGGTLTFAVGQLAAGISAALSATVDSGLAPSTLTLTMDPGRSAVIRTPGTNLFTGGGANNTGGAVQVQLVSPNAINVPPTILVYMHYRDSSMRGQVFPVQTTPNSTTAAYQGLWDIALDEPRHRVYVSNPGFNRVEVFDTQQMQFLDPVSVGSLPHQMAMTPDGTTLYVAHNGGEQIAIIDLDQQQVKGALQLPPIPRAGNASVNSVVAMMAGLNKLQFVLSSPTATSTANNITGTLWEATSNLVTLLGGTATSVAPRAGTSVTGVNAAGAQTPIAAPTQAMQASSDGTAGILVGGNGRAYLYNGFSNTYTTAQQLFTNPIIGYYGAVGASPHGNYLLANGLIMDNSLSAIGGAASPGQITITPGPGFGPGGGPILGVASTGLRNVAAVAAFDDYAFVRMTTAVRTALTTATSDDVHTTLEKVDLQTGDITSYRMPENPVLPQFGTTRTAVPPHQMVVDSQGTVYALTVSGLSVMPLAQAAAPQVTGPGSIVNSNDGTAVFQPGSFITVNGANLASSGIATTLPPPTRMGGSCVLVDGVAIPLLATTPGQISAQLPANLRPGVNVLQVRSLANAQRSAAIRIMVQEP